MIPKEQDFDFTADSYVADLTAWILAIAEIPFANKPIFKTYSDTKDRLIFKSEIIGGREWSQTQFFQDIDTGLFDEQFAETGNKAIFIAEILPIQGRQNFDGIFATFEEGNQAFFEDLDYGNYQKYFEENGIEEGKKMTWQEAYDKICDLARKEQTIIPKLQ